jgi:hypothetical protein
MDSPGGDIRPIPRNPLRFELLHLFDAHVEAARGSLHDPEAPAKFIASLSQPLGASLADKTLLRGLNAEALFEALVVSLGRIQLVKREDSGATWTTRPRLTVPDYRIVLADGTGFLVEVKHFFQKGNPTKRFSITPNYLSGLREYEDIVGWPVKLAIYWSAWNLWTLVPLAACEETTPPSLALEQAMKANEMAVLGDLEVGTRFPLRFRVIADAKHERTLGADGEVQFTIGGVEMYCADRGLTLKREQNIAMWFMIFGAWSDEATAEITDNELVAVNFVSTPPEDPGQGFALVGSLSSLFSSMHRSSTLEGAKVTRFGLDIQPGSLGSLIPDDYTSESLPLWRFRLVGGG